MSVEWNDDLLRDVRAAAFRGVVIGTERLLNEGNRLIREPPKTGRLYRRRGRIHQASAPGEPPASDTGHLIQSARSEFNSDELWGQVNWSTEYAAALEYGTPKMDARPYGSVAVANKREEITDLIVALVTAELS